MFWIISTGATVDLPTGAYFRTVSDSASSFLIAMRSCYSCIFWNFLKITQENSVIDSRLLMLQRGVFRTQANNYDGDAFVKIVND